MANSVIPQGPFQFTAQWNEMVDILTRGMEGKRHRYRFKMVDNCFSAAEAVDYMYSSLKKIDMWKERVTKKSTVALLNKFLKFHVIEDLNGRFGDEDLENNGKLYRLNDKYEGFGRLAGYQQPQRLLAARDVNVMQRDDKQFGARAETTKKSQPATLRELICISIVERFKLVLHLSDGDGDDSAKSLIDRTTAEVESSLGWIETNMQYDASLPQPTPAIPFYILKIMKCLAVWPNDPDNEFPKLPGFEKEVFGAVVDYFTKLPQPLITSELYSLLEEAFVRCRQLDRKCHDQLHLTPLHNQEDRVRGAVGGEMSDAEMIEGIRKRLMQARMRHENIANRRRARNRRNPAGGDGIIRSRLQDNFNNSIHQSMQDLSQIASNHRSESQFPTGILGGSKALVKSARYKPTAASTYNLNNNNNNNKATSNRKRRNSRIDDKPLSNKLQVQQQNHSIMSSVDNLLLDMSSCGFESHLAPPLTSSTPHKNFLDLSLSSSSLSDSDEDDEGGVETWTADTITSSASSSSTLTRTSTLRVAKSEWSLKESCDMIARRIEVEPPASSGILRRTNNIKQRFDDRPTHAKSHHNIATRSSSFKQQPVQYRSDKYKKQASKLQHLPTIIQSPTNADEATDARNISREERARKTKSLFNNNNKQLQEESCMSPLSVALKQAKQQQDKKDQESESHMHATQIFQLLLLALPPSNRRKLFLFLRFADKVLKNSNLSNLHHHLTPRGLLIEKFTTCVLGSTSSTVTSSIAGVAREVFAFMLDNSSHLLTVLPEFEFVKMKQKFNKIKEEKVKKDRFAFCQQMTTADYDTEAKENSEKCLVDLLKNLCQNDAIPSKERKKRLKQFQKSHPAIYERHYKTLVFDDLVKKKTPFESALDRFRLFRL